MLLFLNVGIYKIKINNNDFQKNIMSGDYKIEQIAIESIPMRSNLLKRQSII